MNTTTICSTCSKKRAIIKEWTTKTGEVKFILKCGHLLTSSPNGNPKLIPTASTLEKVQTNGVQRDVATANSQDAIETKSVLKLQEHLSYGQTSITESDTDKSFNVDSKSITHEGPAQVSNEKSVLKLNAPTLIAELGRTFPNDNQCSQSEAIGKNILRNTWHKLTKTQSDFLPESEQKRRPPQSFLFDSWSKLPVWRATPDSHIFKESNKTKEAILQELQRIQLDKAFRRTFLFESLVERDDKWKLLRGYQQRGVEFFEQALHLESNETFQGGVICGDVPGLGKTIQAATLLRYNHAKLTPVLIVVPASLIWNWQRELKTWFSDKYNTPIDTPIVHVTGLELIDGQNVHIISNALINKPEVLVSICNYGFKFMIIDESHQFKNDKSGRTEAIQKISEYIPRKLMLSGSSILNRTTEFYNSLQMARPNEWPSVRYLEMYCARAWDGKKFALLGIDERRKEAFFKKTSPYVIRRRKEDVLTELPEKTINYTFIALNDNKGFVQGYNKVLDELEKVINRIKEDASLTSQILALMAKIRHMIGIAKTGYVINEITKFLENSEPHEKLCIGTHHKLVMDFLVKGIEEWQQSKNADSEFLKNLNIQDDGSKFKDVKIIHMSDESPKVKDEREAQFRDDPNTRIGIISILGCGIGRNLQFCPNVIQMERQWNKEIEGQFGDRFHRFGSKMPVTIDILTAKDTADEFWHTMCELKGNIAESGLDKNAEVSNITMMELAQLCVMKRLKYVG